MKRYLKQYQADNKLNQIELAEEIGISKWSLQRFYKGLVRKEDEVYRRISDFVEKIKAPVDYNETLAPSVPEIIGIVFETNRYDATVYSYLNIGEEVQVGDKVIVNSPRDGLVIVDVVSTHFDRNKCGFTGPMKPIVQKVDFSKHNEFVLKQQRLNELKNNLKKKIQQKMREEIAAKYIQNDPEYKELLELGGTL